MKQRHIKSRQMSCAFWISILFVACVLLCAPPLLTTAGNGNYSIELGLEDGTKTTAKYSGSPIIATIILSDSAMYRDIAWHVGSAYVVPLGILTDKKIKECKVELFWKTMPLCKDTVKKMAYDTIYVSIGGESQRSNKVTVYVTNLAPMVDSVKVGNAAYRLTDTVHHNFAITDTSKTVLIKLFGHDNNRDTLKFDWYSAATKLHVSDNVIVYTMPQKQFTDTLTGMLYDGNGGSAFTVVIVSKLSKNNPPQIDSLKIGTLWFGMDTSHAIVNYAAFSIDTLSFKMYAQDKDSGDVLTFFWNHKNIKNTMIPSATNPSSMILDCDSLYKKIVTRDSTKTIDTVYFLVKDKRGDSATVKIRIIWGYINTPVRIDSIQIKLDSLIIDSGRDAILRETANGMDTFRVKLFTTDPDSGDSVIVNVKALRQTQVKYTGKAMFQYVCRDSLYKDSLIITIKDIAGDSVKRSLVITVNNRAPVIDSIVTGESAITGINVFRATDSVMIRKDTLFANDSLPIFLYAKDPDPLDSITVNWICASGIKVSKKDSKGLVVAYRCAGSDSYTDTLKVVVKDKKQKTVIKNIILYVKMAKRNFIPKIDSLKVNGITRCKGVAFTYTDSASGGDTINVQVYASDPDSGDVVKTTLKAKLATALTVTSDTFGMYICKDSLYKDSIIIIVKDAFGDSAKKTFVLNIVNRRPVIDSIKITDKLTTRDSVFRVADTQSQYKGTIPAKDSVSLRLYAHDPDVAYKDSVVSVQWSMSSRKMMKLLDLKGYFVQYPCMDSTYSDTIMVKVIDRKLKYCKRSFILDIKK